MFDDGIGAERRRPVQRTEVVLFFRCKTHDLV